MTLFLDGDSLSAATERLSSSRGQSTIADFLIFKRALVIATSEAAAAGEPAPTSVATGTSSPPFARAVSEVAAIDASGSAGWTGSPFFSPFGASRDTGKGYKSPKYPSNGPSDTANRWQSRGGSPLQLVEGSRPKAFRFVERTAAELAAFFLLSSEQIPKPALLDVAVWWLRATDLDVRFGGDPSDEQLIAALVDDLGLTDAEIDGLFERPAEGGDDADL